MATTPEFKYQPMFEHGEDTTEYYLLTKDYVSVSEFEGKPILKVEKEGLTAMANAAFHDVSFMLRRSHNEQVAKILNDPEASENDKYVALTFLRNAEVAAKGVLPFCQDTGTAIIHGEKGQQVWTGYCDEEALSLGVYKTYTENNLRYSQNAPLSMYEEVNTRCNLPAQIDLEATEGMEYNFLCVTKGGGSANKTYLYQETKAILNPATLVPFLVEKMKTLGTAACPPYHIAFVIGGTSAEKNLLTVKLASTHYYDNLPTTGNEYGRAFRDIELEKQVLEEAHRIGLGAQFGGKYYAHDVRIIRLPRHGASCPVGLGVSCSADRNIKCKINKDGIWIEKLDSNPGELIPEALRQAGEGNAVKIDFTVNSKLDNTLAKAVSVYGNDAADYEVADAIARMTGLESVSADYITNGWVDEYGFLTETVDRAEALRWNKDAKGKVYTLFVVSQFPAWTEEAALNRIAKVADDMIAGLDAHSDVDGLKAGDKYYTYGYDGNISMVSVKNLDGTTDYYVAYVVNQTVTESTLK